MNRDASLALDRVRALGSLLVCLLAVVLASCSETIEDSAFSQAAPGTGAAGAPDAPCTRLEQDQPDACRIAWMCTDPGRRLTFVCFDEAAGKGCGCMVDEDFTDATTADLSACGDDTAMAALARETCGWDVP